MKHGESQIIDWCFFTQ